MTAPAPPPPPVPATTPAQRAAQAAAALRRRRDDRAAMTRASDALTGLDARVQQLLQRTLDLLDDTAPPPQALPRTSRSGRRPH